MKLSILTATYNRGDLLVRLYESILNNLYDKLSIEWLIMDDGSTDNTEDVVKNFKVKDGFDIKYFKQHNQGKMQAINNLMQYVTGELVMDCDSDDYFVNDAFKEIYSKKDILFENDLYALIFLKSEGDNQISGNRFEKENLDTTMFDMYFKDGITGEKILVFKTDVRKKYNHEIESNEKFITEARMYHKMDLNYGVRCFNVPIVEGKYLSNGYTSNINKTFIESPNGYYKYFNEILQRNMKNVEFKKRLYAINHYILFTYILHKKLDVKEVNDKINKILLYVLFIPGIIKIKLGGIYGK